MCVTHKGIISFRVMSTGELWSLLTRLVPQVPGAERAAIIHRSVVNLALLVRISVVESCWPVALNKKCSLSKRVYIWKELSTHLKTCPNLSEHNYARDRITQ